MSYRNNRNNRSNRSNRGSSLGSTLYGGAAEFGRIMSDISAIVTTIIFMILLIIGIQLVRHKKTRTSSTTATVHTVQTCAQFTDNSEKTVSYDCSLVVQYTVGTKKYTNVDLTISGPIKYAVGDSITVYYDPADPSKIFTSKDEENIIGWILIGVGLVLLVSSWGWYWISHRYKFAAAVGGVDTGIQMFKN
jgi:hypothetical protein